MGIAAMGLGYSEEDRFLFFNNKISFLSYVLKIRPLKTTRVTIEDTEMENCLSKAKFTSVEGHSKQEQQNNRSSFLFDAVGPCPFTQIGPSVVHCLFMSG
jgi:hypothetical protein